MGSLILCHEKKAKRSFDIPEIHRRIYTFEELCHFFCDCIYMADEVFADGRLCDWLRDELDLGELSESLSHVRENGGDSERLVMTVLRYSQIYTSEELAEVQSVLDRLKNLRSAEKRKYKADGLLKSGSLRSAILVYREIIYAEKDEKVGENFYAGTYACLGAAYGRMFLYRDAARMYKSAYEILGERPMLKAHLYACGRYMSEDEYKEYVGSDTLYREADAELREETLLIDGEVTELCPEDTLDDWKRQYRIMSSGEI